MLTTIRRSDLWAEADHLIESREVSCAPAKSAAGGLGLIRTLAGVPSRFVRRRHIGKNFMRKSNRRRHQLFGFATGIAKHNALVARPFILIAAIAVNALRNMR